MVLTGVQRAPAGQPAGGFGDTETLAGRLEFAMNSARAEIADFERGLVAETFFDRGAPLLDVLGGRVRIEGGEADGGFAEDGGSEIQRGLRLRRRKQSCRGREIVELLRLGENIGNVVALVAPGVEV